MKAISSSEASFGNLEEVNFRRNKILYVLVNIISILSFPVFYVVLFFITGIFITHKPAGIFNYFVSFSRMSNGFLFLFLAILLVTMTVHEIIHGLFFYLFTGKKPVFGLKNLSAYAGAPGFYIRKNYYLIVCLSPFILLTIFGTGIFLLSSGSFSDVMFITVSAHAAGCIGDIWVSFKLLNKPGNTFINDNGMVIKIGYDRIYQK